MRRIGPSRVHGAGGISVPRMPAGSRSYKAHGDSRTKGTTPLHLICPSWRTGTEGHACCRCHRAWVSNQEEMGPSRAPTPTRVLCLPAAHRVPKATACPAGAARPVPAHSQARRGPSHPRPPPKGKSNLSSVDISEQFMGTDLPCCRVQPAGSFWEPTQ